MTCMGPAFPESWVYVGPIAKRVQVYSTVNEIRIYIPEERIGQAVDTHEDRPP
jgi:hypothetical protein